MSVKCEEQLKTVKLCGTSKQDDTIFFAYALFPAIKRANGSEPAYGTLSNSSNMADCAFRLT